MSNHTTDDYEISDEGILSRRIGKTWQSRKLKISGNPITCVEIADEGKIAGCILLTDTGKTYLVTGLWDKKPKIELWKGDPS